MMNRLNSTVLGKGKGLLVSNGVTGHHKRVTGNPFRLLVVY